MMPKPPFRFHYGRAVIGLGTSGKLVVENFHGVTYEKPLTRPGARLAYHAITSGFLLAEVARVATGRDLQLGRGTGCLRFQGQVAQADHRGAGGQQFLGLPLSLTDDP